MFVHWFYHVHSDRSAKSVCVIRIPETIPSYETFGFCLFTLSNAGGYRACKKKNLLSFKRLQQVGTRLAVVGILAINLLIYSYGFTTMIINFFGNSKPLKRALCEP